MESLPWLDETWSGVHRSLQYGSTPHALLLHGSDGVGKRQLAQQIATHLLCLNITERGAMCGSCRSCSLLKDSTHPDLHLISPEGKGWQIGIDSVRQLSADLVLRPLISPHKVAIIFEAERLNPYSANALLKTLEEPTPDTHILLITAHPTRLLATIRSRCHAVRCTGSESANSVGWLKSHGVSVADATSLLQLTSGAPLKALEFFQQQTIQVFDEAADQLSALSQGRISAIKVAKLWIERKDMLYLEWYYRTILAALRRKIRAEIAVDSGNPQQRLLIWLSHRGYRELLEFMEAMKQTLRLWNGQVNRLLLLEGLLLRWQRL